MQYAGSVELADYFPILSYESREMQDAARVYWSLDTSGHVGE
jgi:3-mercaptopyruvate sulfurtransferase SseA